MGVFVVERYASGLTVEGVGLAAARISTAAPAATVTHVLSVLVPADDAALSIFAAQAITEVEDAARREGTPFERVVAAVLTD